MRKSIQCWQCGTRMTLDALASNDGDCPECEVEIHLGEYLSEALDTNQRLEAELAKAHEYGYQYRQERNRTEAELAAFKAQVPVAEVDKTVPSAEIQWTDRGEEMCLPHGTKLYAAPAQSQNVEPFPPTSTPEPGWDSGYESGYNDAIAQIKSAPAQQQSDAVQSNDGEVIELLAKLRQMVCATPQNDMDRSGVWISTNHPVIKRIDALLGGDQPAPDPLEWSRKHGIEEF